MRLELDDPVLDATHGPTRMLLAAEHWREKYMRAKAPTWYPDAFDEHDACDALAGLPVEHFNPGPAW